MGFTCSVCGRFHEEDARDIRMTWPEPVARLTPEERERRVVATDDFCTLDAEDGVRFYARGLLEIPIHDEDACFGYGAWLDIDRETFERLRTLWFDPDAEGTVVDGRLANELTPYRATEGLAVELRLRDARLLPRIEPAESAHPLVRDWVEGIDPNDARVLAESVLHPS